MDNALLFFGNVLSLNLDTIHIGGAVLIGLLAQSHVARVGLSFLLALFLALTVAFLRAYSLLNESPIWFAMAFLGILLVAYTVYWIKWCTTKVLAHA